MFMNINDLKLLRFWFPASVGFGVGVTAWSVEEAKEFAKIALDSLPKEAKLDEPVVGVDIRDLDQLHVAPNMLPCNLRGVWYPAGVFIT
jgi:hypothetical protein